MDEVRPRSVCYRCGMSFRIEEPPAPEYGNGKRRLDICRCSVRGCGRRFWHALKERPYTAIVGVFPKDCPNLKPFVGPYVPPLARAAE